MGSNFLSFIVSFPGEEAMTTLYSLRCASCSAPLSVPANVKQFACRYCGNEQRVVSEGDTLHLQSSISAIKSSSERIASELALERLAPKLLVSERTFDSIRGSIVTEKERLKEARYSIREHPQWIQALENAKLPSFSLRKHANLSVELDLAVIVAVLAGTYVIFASALALVISGLIVIAIEGFYILSGWKKYTQECREARRSNREALRSQESATRNLESNIPHVERYIEDLEGRLPIAERELTALKAEVSRHRRIVDGPT